MNSILLLEDNENDIILMKRAFKKLGMSVELVIARDGIEGLEYLSNANTRLPDLILLDLRMPRMDGKEFLAEIRKNPEVKRIPIIVLSSSSETEDICDSYELGANSYLQKPVEYERFVSLIQALEQYWFSMNILPSKGEMVCDG